MDHPRDPGVETGISEHPGTSGYARGTAADEQRLLRLAGVALERYGLGGARTELLLRNDKKQFFRVTSPTRGEFILRMYRLSYSPWERLLSSEEALRSQSLWLDALGREAGLSVPDPIPTVDGAMTSCASIAGLRRLRICVLQRWVPGRHRSISELEPRHCSLLGSYIARMHNHAERYSPPEGFSRPTWGWGQIFGDSAPIWNEGRNFHTPEEMSVFYATARRTQRELRALGKGKEVFGLIHRDLNQTNLLFGDGGVSAVDFDGCGWGYYFYDLALVMLDLEKAKGHSAEFQAALLEGYNAERPLPENHRELLDTFMAMRRVSKINRTLGPKAHTGNQRGPHLLPDTVEALREFTKGERGFGNYVRYRISSWRKYLRK